MRWIPLLYGLLAYLAGIRTLVYFALFASNVPLIRTVDQGPGAAWTEAVAIDLALLLAFAVSHSLLARVDFGQRYARLLPAATLRSTYVLIAAASLSLLMWQWRPVTATVWDLPWPAARGLLFGLAAAGWLLAAIAYYSVDHLTLMGLRQAWTWCRRRQEFQPVLVTTGIYGWLRNPMYLGFLVGLWSTPRMSVGRLVLAAGMSLYILVGVRFERTGLERRFGSAYQEYRRRRPWRHLLSSLAP